jgi:hypothetical protein
MNVLRVSAALVLGLAPAAATALGAEFRAGSAPAAGNIATNAPAEREHNVWPAYVLRKDARDREVERAIAGPFVFAKPDPGLDAPEGGTVSGLRPFWVQHHDGQGGFRAGYFLYPLFSYSVDANTYKWSFFELVRSWGRRAGAAAPDSVYDRRGEFEVFPFWFSREAGDAELSYRALFPIHGTIKNKLFFERLSWTLFPLYVQSEKRGATQTFAPWPIVRIQGGAARGWGIWPLYNHVERPGRSKETHVLWPFIYSATRQPHPDDPPGTPARRDLGVLPFWARSTGPGFVNQDYAWPFAGYTERTAPYRYSERRYFWPFLVQGRGDNLYVSRFAPFYTHSVIKGMDKQWFMWPLVRQAEWVDEGVARSRTQFLWFLYWNEEQQVAGRPNTPSAELTHVWPLVSHWENGAGRKQWQFPSPLEVFFPQNDKVRTIWSPLFSLARHDQRAPGETRTSLLWNAITYEEKVAEQRRELHVGPLLSVAAQAEEKRVALGNGLVSFKRESGRWRIFWFDFPSKRASTPPASSSGTR